MGFMRGEGRAQGALFPVTLEELIPEDHICRVIDAFVDRLDMAGLGFERADPADTRRPGCDPRDLLKLYLYGYLQQVRSSRVPKITGFFFFQSFDSKLTIHRRYTERPFD
jgi:transposase